MPLISSDFFIILLHDSALGIANDDIRQIEVAD